MIHFYFHTFLHIDYSPTIAQITLYSKLKHNGIIKLFIPKFHTITRFTSITQDDPLTYPFHFSITHVWECFNVQFPYLINVGEDWLPLCNHSNNGYLSQETIYKKIQNFSLLVFYPQTIILYGPIGFWH